jgi:hypothetical protein
MTEAYDAVAARYAGFVRGELDHLPLDRAVLAAFAKYVGAAGGGLVAELRCGPGRITAHLRDLGLDACQPLYGKGSRIGLQASCRCETARFGRARSKESW